MHMIRLCVGSDLGPNCLQKKISILSGLPSQCQTVGSRSVPKDNKMVSLLMASNICFTLLNEIHVFIFSLYTEGL